MPGLPNRLQPPPPPPNDYNNNIRRWIWLPAARGTSCVYRAGESEFMEEKEEEGEDEKMVVEEKGSPALVFIIRSATT